MTERWMIFGAKAVNMALAKVMTQSAAGVLITMSDNHPDVLAADVTIDDIVTAMAAGQARVVATSRNDAIAPHAYAPDFQAMGDCRTCGHGADVPWHQGERILQAWERRLSEADPDKRHFDDGLTKPPRTPGNDPQAMRSIGR